MKFRFIDIQISTKIHILCTQTFADIRLQLYSSDVSNGHFQQAIDKSAKFQPLKNESLVARSYEQQGKCTNKNELMLSQKLLLCTLHWKSMPRHSNHKKINLSDKCFLIGNVNLAFSRTQKYFFFIRKLCFPQRPIRTVHDSIYHDWNHLPGIENSKRFNIKSKRVQNHRRFGIDRQRLESITIQIGRREKPTFISCIFPSLFL